MCERLGQHRQRGDWVPNCYRNWHEECGFGTGKDAVKFNRRTLRRARSFYQYPITNAVNAWKTLQVELDPSNLPSYGMFPPWAIQRLLSELPLVGQVFQINTGPEHRDRDLSPDRVNRQIFISRGIYGGDEAGQDTGLWAARTYDAYPQYEVYSLPYKHGTVIDVVWSMFNLSHGPGYAEAKYIMDGPTGPFDHLFLTGHSGGVQRSAAASRILAKPWL